MPTEGFSCRAMTVVVTVGFWERESAYRSGVPAEAVRLRRVVELSEEEVRM